MITFGPKRKKGRHNLVIKWVEHLGVSLSYTENKWVSFSDTQPLRFKLEIRNIHCKKSQKKILGIAWVKGFMNLTLARFPSICSLYLVFNTAGIFCLVSQLPQLFSPEFCLHNSCSSSIWPDEYKEWRPNICNFGYNLNSNWHRRSQDEKNYLEYCLLQNIQSFIILDIQ